MTAQRFWAALSAAVLALTLTLTGCSDEPDPGEQLEDAGEAAEQTMEETGEEMKETGETAVDKAEEAAREMEKGSDKTLKSMQDGEHEQEHIDGETQ